MAANKEHPTEEAISDVDEAYLEQAMCVLAGSDPENCSYSRGYVKRQAVFACNTCTSNPEEPAGVCLACANKCHDGHDIFELYTKRNFRCDCGNGKFGEFKCQLIPSKDPENVKNQYNHNYQGCYCTCNRLYPDPDGQDSDEMSQCVICEDWFHMGHLGCTVVEPEELQEMVCEACMNKAPFLWTYAAHFAVPPVVTVSHPEEEEAEVEVEEEKKEAPESSQSGNKEASSSHKNMTQEEAESRRVSCKRTYDEMSGSSVEATAKTVVCKLKDLEGKDLERPKEGAVFWPYNWRSQLCTCTSCKRAYVSAEVQFLMDPSDTLLAYEKKGLEEAPILRHLLQETTNSMSRVQQLEVIYGIQEMTAALDTFLQQCEAEGKTVTAEAIRQCFEDLTEARKRRRTNARYE